MSKRVTYPNVFKKRISYTITTLATRSNVGGDTLLPPHEHFHQDTREIYVALQQIRDPTAISFKVIVIPGKCFQLCLSPQIQVINAFFCFCLTSYQFQSRPLKNKTKQKNKKKQTEASLGENVRNKNKMQMII